MSEPEYHLLGTYTRYSSWTARVEAVLEYFDIPYTTRKIPLDQAKTHSPSGLIPLLTSHTHKITITDSLAIVEYLAEQNPEKHLWPSNPTLRALARSATAEMHSGFATLRNTYHTNFVARYTGNIPVSEAARREIRRVLSIWDNARKVTVERLGQDGDEDEGFLFGRFSIADAWFWPLLWRIRSYNLPLDDATPDALKWMEKMWSDPKTRKLIHGYHRQAEDPATRIEKYDGLFAEYGVEYSTFPEDWTFTAPASGAEA
ncbi:glutathione S-transferase [Aspergillus stella-maris]|uniref:glutathione S-transferase n=1 Tax=Aspergillus stella-maris TaxID=1810926 RepID=UPI003CCCE2AC